jgi:hypothetical protein
MQIFGSKKTKWNRQESQHLGARKTNGINRRAKIWEQEKQMVETGEPKSQMLALLSIPFGFLAPKDLH